MGYDEAFYKAGSNTTTLNVYNIMKNHTIPDPMFADLICATECIQDINKIKKGELLIVVAGERDAMRGSTALSITRDTSVKLSFKETHLLSQAKMIPIGNLVSNNIEYEKFFRDLEPSELENRIRNLKQKNFQNNPQNVKNMLHKSGIESSPRLIKNIQKLNQKAGKFLEVKEIQQMQKMPSIADNLDTKKLVDSICKDMRQLEMVMMR